jgi:hypothetical protein
VLNTRKDLELVGLSTSLQNVDGLVPGFGWKCVIDLRTRQKQRFYDRSAHNLLLALDTDSGADGSGDP